MSLAAAIGCHFQQIQPIAWNAGQLKSNFQKHIESFATQAILFDGVVPFVGV